MKEFFRRLSSWMHRISVIISTPPPRPVRVSAHCTNINMLLMHLCDFDADSYSYVLQWLAYPLRNPGAKMSYGIVVNGNGYRSGTSLFFQHVAVSLHQGNAKIIHSSQLDDRYKSWATAPLVVVDGSATQRAMDIVKGLMAADNLLINRKGQLPALAENRMNFVFLSDDINSRRRSLAARRFMVIDAPPARERVFYQAIAHEIENGGVDAFRDYLMHGIDMDGFNETTLPPGLRDDPVLNAAAADAIRRLTDSREAA